MPRVLADGIETGGLAVFHDERSPFLHGLGECYGALPFFPLNPDKIFKKSAYLRLDEGARPWLN
jgi:hypothetical protein